MRIAAAVFVALLLSAAFCRADGPATQPDVEPALAPDAALLAKIAALPENAWLKLPAVRTAGELAWCGQPDWPNTGTMPRFGPGVRDYCNKMVWAPDRGRALYCGGNHQTPHYINDVWEYDLASNTWACLFAPDPQYPRKLKETAVFKDGLVQTRRGGPLRPCHTWWGLCYHAQMRRLLWLEPHQGLVFVDSKALAEQLGVDPVETRGAQGGARNKTTPGWYIWSFDPYARTWDAVLTGVPVGGEAATLEYLPDLKTCWLIGYTYPLTHRQAGGLFDPRTRAFTPQAPSKTLPAPEAVVAYDPAKRRAVAVRDNRTWAYDFASDTWTLAQASAPIGGSDSRSFLCFDPSADRFVLYTRTPPGGLWLYDLAKNQWTEPRPDGEAPPPTGRLAGYYDPARNVTVLYTGREVWVYRAQRASGRS